MSILTNFLKLLKPEPNDYVDVEKHISENYDKIDNKIEELDGYINKKTTQTSTIAELQSRKNLKVGDIVEVLGYYSAGDGAGHKRIISREDDGSGVQLKNGLWANIVHNSEVNVSWLGAKNNGIDDNTEIIQKAINTNAKFIILNDNVKCNGFFVKEQQKIINKGKLILTGTIFLQESSTFDGGTIVLNECFAFTLRADDRKSLRNVTISNVKIFGKKNKSEGAIKFESSINNYVTFCNFINVNTYNCWKGIFGEIRASKFILNLEQNEYPISIVGQQNLILLTGQAGLYTENSKIIYIDGSLNKIYGSFYDVGKKVRYQNIFAEFSENSFDNECPVNLGPIIQGTTRNSYNSYVELNKLFLKDEPAFSITYNNVNTFDESKFFKYDNFYWTITRISDESDGYIELNLGILVLFSGIEMFFISKEYAFTKIEIYSNDILLTTLIPGSSIFKYVKPTFESYYNNRNQQVKIRCYVNSEVRFRGANLYL